MAYSSTLSSTKSKKKPPFVPSPRWLSESPAYVPAFAEVDSSGRPLSGHSSQQTYSAELKSPIPPPPANLYPPGTPSAFNVDPGVPFAATQGPTDAGSDNGSVRDEPQEEKRFVGGLVTGIKKVVRNSLRAASRSQYQQQQQYQPQQQPGWNQSIYAQPPEFRDSGYAASSSQLAPAPLGPAPGVLSPIQDVQSPPPSSHRVETIYSSPRPPSETLIGHAEPKFGRQRTPSLAPQEIIPPEIMSPVSASLEPGSDYGAMNATPPPSEASLRTYFKRVKKIAKDVHDLPWVAKERVTTDYYPERTRRRDEPKHPAIAWRSHAFAQMNYRASFGASTPVDEEEYEESGSSILPLNAPHQRSHSIMDLNDEFDANPTPVPQGTPHGSGYFPFTPSRDNLPADPPQAQPLFTLPSSQPQIQTPAQRTYQPPLPTGSILLQSNPNPPDAHRTMSPSQPWSAAVRSAQHTPIFPVTGRESFQYDTPNINTPDIPSPRTPPVQTPKQRAASISHSYSQSRPQIPAGQNQYGDRPIHLTSQRPAYDYNYYDDDIDNYTPTPAPGHTHRRRASQSQSQSGAVPRTPRTPAAQAYTPAAHGQNLDDWEAFPQERHGYVPSHLAENYYGMRYGPGVHAQRPPVAPPPLSGPSSVASLR
ncbi:hypothetical protein GALMADRAFT_157273 [Galerina marginata CBS 339.88]|uniref:Uncharacterized protein n=1 Tax=Galerina marginata (strain CBS 339.88) TaxID=685588 RepID=A0A067SUJ8_GALM3|nr:hypothetical protein GALMADRAFT_157273 [Galerina marginata CBS 339.88]